MSNFEKKNKQEKINHFSPFCWEGVSITSQATVINSVSNWHPC